MLILALRMAKQNLSLFIAGRMNSESSSEKIAQSIIVDLVNCLMPMEEKVT